jgi:hypothetical protein
MINFGTLRPDTWDEPETIDGERVELLGAVHRRRFAVLPDKREVELGAVLMPPERSNEPRHNEVWVEQATFERNPMNRQLPPIRIVTTTRAYVVETGTYAKLAAEEKERVKAKQAAAERASRPRLWSAATFLPQLDRVDPKHIAFGVTDSPNPLAPILDRTRKTPKLIATEGRPAVRGFLAIRQWLAARGVPKVLRVMSTRMDKPVAEVLQTYGRPLKAEEVGKPLMCVIHPDRPAWDVDVVGDAYCEECFE